ncbi:MAG: toprim domain-containing protein [Planctomycetes bacterium]|nr:toprim domain-containing protein [Planctomycetota bacterium]
MPLREDQKIQVQQATDIVRLIGEHVAIKPKGKEYLGLCPFHDDKNPSLHVVPLKQIYICFSCGAKGDAFAFMMNYHKMTFPEALKHLAERAGIKLEEHRRKSGPPQEGPTDRQRVAAANAQGVEFFRALYRHPEHGQTARAYVAKRGISPEMLEAFQIGYAPDRWDGLVTMVREKNWDAKGFTLAGLISPRQNRNSPESRVQSPESRAEEAEVPDASASSTLDSGLETLDSGLETLDSSRGHYDRLRHRLIFPIFDALGRPIAFGGRKLREEDEPKYLNSPETMLFNKSATLYGLHLAKKPIIDSRVAVVVEGYTDVIACHQAGVRNVVATLGTALTSQHVSALRHFADKVVLIYDGDEAGIRAADRAVEVFLTGDMDVAIATLPDELDPDELFALPDGKERWNVTINSAIDALDYQFRRVRSTMESSTTLTGRQRVAEEYLTTLARLGLGQAGEVRRGLLIARLAEMLHLDERTITELLRRLAPARRPTAPASGGAGVSGASAGGMGPSPSGNTESNVQPGAEQTENNRLPDVAGSPSASKIKALQVAERNLIGCLIRHPELFHLTLSDGRALDEAVAAGDLVTPGVARLYERLHAYLSEGTQIQMALMLADLASDGETELSSLLIGAEAAVDAATLGDVERASRLLRAEADAILAYMRDSEYRQARAALNGNEANQTDREGQAQRLLNEHRKANPSSIRIARFTGS